MGVTGALQAAGPSVLAIGAISDAYSNSEAKKAQAAYQEGIYNVDARFADIQAEDSIARGEFAADEITRRSNKNLAIIRTNIKQVKGAQKTALAAQGIETTSGSAADVQVDTEYMGQQDINDVTRNTNLDVITIKNNAWREAWGFKTQAEIYRGQGRIARQAGDVSARQTLLSGGTKALGYGLDAYAQYQRTNSKVAPRNPNYNSNKPTGEYT